MTVETAPLFLSAEAVNSRLARADVKAALKAAFAELARGSAVQPPQTLVDLPGGAGDFVVYLGALAGKGFFGAKLSPYLTGLAKAGAPPVTAYTLLFSIATGRPVLLVDSLGLTTARTAATTALALDYLAPAKASKLAVIGAGAVARRHIIEATRDRSWASIQVFSPSLAKGENGRREALLSELPDMTIARSAEATVRDADVVMLCTSSGTPVIDMAWLKEEVTVTSISTNVANAHEIPPVALTQLQVFCDYRPTCPLAAGDMRIAARDHGWDPSKIIADLPELVQDEVELPRGRRYFRSIGLGIEDVAAATLLADLVS